MTAAAQTATCPHCGTPYPGAPAEPGTGVECARCGKSFTPIPATSAESPLDEHEQRIAALAIRLQLLAPDQAARAAAVPHTDATAGSRFMAAGLLTREQLNHLQATLAFKQERVFDSRFGNLALERGWAKPEQITAALEEQKRIFLTEGRAVLLGTLLIQHRVLTEAQTDALLLLQARVRTDTSQLGARVMVTHDHMRATLVLHGSGKPPSLEELHEFLVARGIVHGIDEPTLRGIASGEITASEGVVVASGTPPAPPQPGAIEYLFDTHPLKGASERGEGMVDFRDRGDVPQVPAGAEVARATPPVPGTPGTNVLGQPIAPAKAKETPLKVGKGAQLSADKLSITATVDGRPSLSATGVLSVFPEYDIKGDVDFSTGHINFHGRVVVAGTVRSGFRVRCGELVAKEIEGAQIEADGDVIVNGGIIRAHIRTGGTLRARYLHQSKVEALGDVVVAREVVDSQAEASGNFDSPECVVLASRISAMNGIQAKEIGSETSTPCQLICGVDERVQNENARIQAAIDAQVTAANEVQHRMDALDKRNGIIATEIGPIAQLQDRAQVRLRELQKAHSSAAEARAEMAALREQSHLAEERLNALFAEQEQLRKQKENDTATLAGIEEVRKGLLMEKEQLKEWAGERPGRFQIVGDFIHQQTLIIGPHLEVRLDSDRKAAHLVEREKIEHGHSSWVLVSN